MCQPTEDKIAGLSEPAQRLLEFAEASYVFLLANHPSLPLTEFNRRVLTEITGMEPVI